MSYGRYPDVPLVGARECHAAARKLLAAGIDPMAKRKVDKAVRTASDANSFRTAALLWPAHWRVGKSERYADTTSRRLEANMLPLLGARPIAEIEAPELVAMAKAPPVQSWARCPSILRPISATTLTTLRFGWIMRRPM
jgi:hypothetical protein